MHANHFHAYAYTVGFNLVRRLGGGNAARLHLKYLTGDYSYHYETLAAITTAYFCHIDKKNRENRAPYKYRQVRIPETGVLIWNTQYMWNAINCLIIAYAFMCITLY